MSLLPNVVAEPAGKNRALRLFSGAARSSAVVVSLMVVLMIASYLPVRNHAFVSYDDDVYVTANPSVQAGVTWEGVKWAFTATHAGNWHPLTWISHMIDVAWLGKSPLGPHVVNVLLHLANALLVFSALRRLTGAIWRSGMVAGLFAMHPLRVESVAWVAERKDVLGAFFFLITVWAYARRFRREASGAEPVTRGDSHLWHGVALLAFACGLMSKPTVVTLPCVLLLLDVWPLRRIALRRTAATGEGSSFLSLLREKAPFFVLSFLACVTTFVVQRQAGAMQSLAELSLPERLGNVVVSYARYLGKTLWPVDLAVYYPHPARWPAEYVVAAILLVGGVTFAVIRAARRAPFAAVGWFWFLGMLVPTIGLVQVGGQSIADRYTYLPSIGLLVAVVWSASEIAARWPRARGLIVAIGLAAIGASGFLTSRQAGYWRNSESLFARALAVTTNNDIAHDGLGNALLERGQHREAIRHFERAIAIDPSFAGAHTNLGSALLEVGDLARAIGCFETAFRIEPQNAVAANNLGDALMRAGRPADAVRCYRAVLNLQPFFGGARHNLGMALWQTGRAEEAIAEFRGIASQQPNNPIAWNNLGWLLRMHGKAEEAADHCRRAVELNPQFAEARVNWAKALLVQGEERTALSQLETASHLQPTNPLTLAQLAWLLATARDPAIRDHARAWEIARRANQLGAENPVVLRVLAAACAARNDTASAVRFAEHALRWAETSRPELAPSIQDDLERYKSGRALSHSAYRDPQK